MFMVLLALSCNDKAPDDSGLEPADSTTDTAEEGGISYVLIEPSGVLLTPDQPSVDLVAVAYDAAGNPLEGEVTWFTDDPDITLDDGTVTAVNGLGSAQVTAIVDGVESAPAFIMLAEPTEGAVLIPDAAVTDGYEVDPVDDWGLGWKYAITVEGLDAPEPGTIVLSGGELPIMGRLVSVTEDDWVLELVGPDEAFVDFLIDEDIDLTGVRPEMDPSLEGTHELVQDGDTWVVQSIDGAERGFGSYECDAQFSGAQIGLGQMKAELNHDLSFEFDWSSDDGFQRMLVLGELELKGEVVVSASAAVEGTLACRTDVFKIPVPVAGPISAVARPQVEFGDGLDYSGKLQVLDMGVKVAASAKGTFKAGLDCSTDECDWVGDFEPTAGVTFTTNTMDLSQDFRFEASVKKFNYEQMQLAIWAGPVELWSLGLQETKAGIQEEWKLSPNLVQAKNGSFSSTEKLNIFVEHSSPLMASAQQTLNQITGLLKVTLPSFTLTYSPYVLAQSPRADPSLQEPFRLNSQSIMEGEDIEVTLDLDPNTNDWMFIDNVDTVALYTLRENTLTEIQRITAGTNQTQFVFTWTPTAEDEGDPPSLHAFVEPEFWPAFSLVELEVASKSFGCQPTYTSEVAVQIGDSGLTSIAGNTGSINDSGVISFVGSDSEGETLFYWDGTLNKPAHQGGGRSYGGGGAINNSGQMIVRERTSWAYQLVRRWESNGDYTVFGTSWDNDFVAPISWMDINNSGVGVFPALTDDGDNTTVFVASAEGNATPLVSYSGTVFARPMISDDGTVVFRDNQDRIVLNASTVIDSGAERHPGISAKGNEVGWIKGTGVYWGRPSDSYTPVAVVQADDTWSAVDGDSRVGVAFVEDACPGGADASLVVFVGTAGGVNGVHVATLLNGKVVGIQTLLSEGDTVDGLTLNSFKLNDPMSAKGLVVVRAETSGGAAFIRLTPTWPS